MFLRKYTDSDFPILKSWVTDPDLLFLFAGSNWTFPLQFEEVKNYQRTYPFKQSYMLCNAKEEPIAFGELISGEPNAPRLGRLLVGEAKDRGKGIGKVLIQQMILESRKRNEENFIHLFVFEDNFPAIRCYTNMGFIFNHTVTVPISRPNRTVTTAVLMTLTFDD